MNNPGNQSEVHAFQVDPGWYEAQWLTPDAPKTPGALQRMATRLATSLGAFAAHAVRRLVRLAGTYRVSAGASTARMAAASASRR